MPTGRTPVGIFTEMIENTRLRKRMDTAISMLQHAGAYFRCYGNETRPPRRLLVLNLLAGFGLLTLTLVPAGVDPAGRIMKITNVNMNTCHMQMPLPPIHNWHAHERICYMMVDAFVLPAGH